MKKTIVISQKLESFNKEILIEGDKSLSIRWVLFASLASGVSRCFNLLMSEDVLAAIKTIKKLGIKVKLDDKYCKIYGRGIVGYKIKKKTIINAENSGTLGRLILGLLVNSTNPIKLIGDKSLSKRDFKRITDPLKKFGVNFKLNKNNTLPLTMVGSNNLRPINYTETLGSAQCKSSVIFAGLRTPGTTFIKAKKSRNHTELLCKYLNLPIKIENKKNYDLIKISKAKKIRPLNYNIPSDLSSSAFFIVLTALSQNSKLRIKNVNINPSRIGAVTILKKMGVKIFLKNKKIYKGEKIADIQVESTKKIKSINCPTNLNSGAIDEFLIIFLVAAKAKGISYFKDLAELNKKESPRLKWGAKILRMMGIKTVLTNHSIKIYGNPDLKISKKITIKDYLKDHRIFMASTIAALSFGGKWQIHDTDSVKTSFPSFIKNIQYLRK
jgi:3-phosphoshikimate 1-carboxyvinyltransferase